MTTVTDEQIMAWLDGELSPEQREQIEALVAVSPELARRTSQLSKLESMLAPAYAETLKAPIPARFDALLAKPRGSVWSLSGLRSVLAGVFDVKPLAMAAGALVVGVIAGGVLLGAPQAPGFETTVDGALIANSAMATSLASLHSGEGGGEKAVRIKLSVVDDAGHFCRQFETSDSAGLACLEGETWKVDALAKHKASSSAGQYVMADGETDPAIKAALERRGVQQVLDRSAESAAIAAGWNAPKH